MTWKQLQRGGDGSTNIQASVVNYGLGYEDVVSITTRHINESLAVYSESAHAEAKRRVEELTINFLTELREKNPDALANAQDPDIQSAILEAQSAYAKSGQPELGSVLVDLIVRRVSTADRGVQQLATSQAIAAIGRMSPTHIKLCTTLFLTQSVSITDISNLEVLFRALGATLSPFIIDLRASASDVEYLSDIGAARMDLLGGGSLVERFINRYPGLFSLGVGKDAIGDVELLKKHGILASSIYDPSLFQVQAASEEDLDSLIAGIDVEVDAEELRKALTANRMSEERALEELKARIPGFREFSLVWEEANMGHVSVNVVGKVIAHANAKRILGAMFDPPLGIWVS